MKKKLHKPGKKHNAAGYIEYPFLSGVMSRKNAARLMLVLICSESMPAFSASSLPCGGCGNVTLPMPIPAAAMPTPCVAGIGNCVNDFIQPNTNTIVNIDPKSTASLMTIHQLSQTAILNWKDFNIAHGNTVVFDQPGSTSSALNKIWNNDPSLIAGALKANGQIYLINHNGIIFANGAKIDTGTLIASSLDISDDLFTKGYLTNFAGTPAFQGIGGFVRVDTGAELNGSRIMLFAPVVENNGSIKTPDGQTVLAAGNKIYLAASQDPNLVGVLVEVDVSNPGAVDPALIEATSGISYVRNNASGTVTNASAGSVSTGRGNITLMGYAVNQEGNLSATTSVSENGSIKLLARHNVLAVLNITQQQDNGNTGYNDIRASKTGVVTLAENSITRITVDSTDTSTATADQPFNKSIVEVMGNTVNMKSGSSIVAHGGQVTLAAISEIDTTAPPNININVYQEISPLNAEKTNAYSSFLNPNYKPAPKLAGDSARVFLDSGSSIDVSGSTADVSVARNILSVQLRGSQLADAPLQRNGFLWGKNVNIDIRHGSAMVNYSGEEPQIARGVNELTSAGGSVNLVSTGDVVAKAGSRINLSGGQINYAGAVIQNTQLISKGTVYDIANAPSDLIYDGIVGSNRVYHAKWGVTETFNSMAGGDVRGRWDAG